MFAFLIKGKSESCSLTFASHCRIVDMIFFAMTLCNL